MDNALHFVLTGDNSQLIDTLEQTQKAFDGLEAVTSKYGITAGEALNLVSQHMQATSEGGQALKESVSEASQALDDSKRAAEEACNAVAELDVKYRSVMLNLRSARTELENTSVDNVARIQELNADIEKLEGELENLKIQIGSHLDDMGVKFEVSTGDPVEMADSGSQGESIDEDAARAERLNNTLNETVGKFEQIQNGLNESRDKFEQLINTADSNGGDYLRLAENNDKITAINERISTLDKGYDAAANAINAACESLKQAVADGNQEQVNALEDTIRKISENKLKIEEEAKSLTETRKKLQQENEQIRSSANQVQEDAGHAAEPPVDKFAKLKDMIGQVGGGMGQMGKGFKALASGGASAAGGLSMIATGFKGLTAAMVSNPYLAAIAAVIVVVKQLVDAFKRNEDAMTALQKIAAPFKALWQTIQRLFDDIVRVFVNVNNNIQRITGGFNGATASLLQFRMLIASLRLNLALIGNALTVASNGVAFLVEKLRSATRESTFGQWLKGIVDSVKNFLGQVDTWIKKVASSKLGKALGMDSLYENIKEIFGAQSELEKKNQEIADLENARNKKARANLIENAKHQAKLTQLRREYAEAAGNAPKQAEISKKITAEERAIKKNDLDLAQMELNIIRKKNSLVQSGEKNLDEQAQAEANVIRLQAEYENAMSSQERGTQRRLKNDEYRKLKGELDSERDLQLEAYKQQKIDARDNRDELQRIEMEEFAFKQTMKKKELDLQLKYDKISRQDYELHLQQMAAAAKTHAEQIAAGNFDYFRDARIKLDNGVNKKNDQEEIKAEVDALKERLKYENSIIEKQRIQSVIRQKNLELELASIENEKRNKIREVYKEEGLRQYDEGTLNDVVGVTAAYDKKAELATAKAQREGEQEDMASHLKDYENYFKERLRIAKEYSQRVNNAMANTNLTDDQKQGELNAALADRNNQMRRLGDMYNGALTDGENQLVEKIVKLETSVTYGALDDARQLYSQLITEIDQQIQQKNDTISSIQSKIDELNTIEGQLSTGTKQIVGENGETQTVELTDSEKEELEARREELLNGQADATAARLEYERQITAELQARGELDDARQAVEEQVTDIQEKQKEIQDRQIQDMQKKTQALASMFGSIASSARNLGDIFGGVLSKNGKKAINAIAGISDVAKDSLSTIAQLIPKISGLFATTKVQSISAQTEMTATNVAGQTTMTATEVGASATMVAASTTAAEAIKNVERASVILAIISAVIQVIMALVSVLKSVIKTQAQEIQENIDKHKEKLEELKKQHEKLERAYKNSVGSDYYKGMAAAAADYNKIIKENNDALREAQQLYELQKQKYGEDSDKAKDAKEQYEELEKNGNDYADSQKELYDDLAENLLGTNVTQFSENLADNLVDAWMDGTTEMEDVWNDMLDDMQRDMMKKALSIALTDMFEDTFNRISNLAKNGELNQSEIDQAIAEIDAKSAQAQAIAEQWKQAMAERGLLDEGDTEGSKGFGQMTQDQADTLTARFTALQMEGANVVAIAQLMYEGMLEQQGVAERQTSLLQSIDQYQQLAFLQAQEHLDQLQIIADNTALLSETNTRLKAIEQNTNKL